MRDQKTLILYVGAAALVLGLYLTLDALRRAHEAQIADRFPLAVDLLSDDNLEIRLGGIYALERMAWVPEQYDGGVIEILSTFVRDIRKRRAGRVIRNIVRRGL
ncbi:MAG: hypothetical protein ACREIS_03835 [Nitrospiraceae bacterium]